jgi:hypothetical protein
MEGTGKHTIPAADAFIGIVNHRALLRFCNSSDQTGCHTGGFQAVHTALAGLATVFQIDNTQKPVVRKAVLAGGAVEFGFLFV